VLWRASAVETGPGDPCEAPARGTRTVSIGGTARRREGATWNSVRWSCWADRRTVDGSLGATREGGDRRRECPYGPEG